VAPLPQPLMRNVSDQNGMAMNDKSTNIMGNIFLTISIIISLVWATLPLFPFCSAEDLAFVPWMFLTFPALALSLIFRIISIKEGAILKYMNFDYIVWIMFFIIGIIISKGNNDNLIVILYFVFLVLLFITSIGQWIMSNNIKKNTINLTDIGN
jgi:hypothetical protein